MPLCISEMTVSLHSTVLFSHVGAGNYAKKSLPHLSDALRDSLHLITGSSESSIPLVVDSLTFVEV